MTHAQSLDGVGHEWLVQHANACYLGVVSDAHPTDAIVSHAHDFTCTSGAVTANRNEEVGQMSFRLT